MIEHQPFELSEILSGLSDLALVKAGSDDVRFLIDIDANVPTKLRFTLANSGVGISEEEQTRLFQDFMQADSSTTRRYGGTELGLAICKQLVVLMGGDIEAIPNEGTPPPQK